LESVEGGERWGRWSYVAADAILEVVGSEDGLSLSEGSAGLRKLGNPLLLIEELFKTIEIVDPMGADADWPGRDALFGAFGHELCRINRNFANNLAGELAPPPRAHFPMLSFFLPGSLLIFDRLKNLVHLQCTLKLESGESLDIARARAELGLDTIEGRLERLALRPLTALASSSRGPRKGPRGPALGEFTEGTSSALPQQDEIAAAAFSRCTSQPDYEAAVSKAIEAIRAGEVIQVVLSQSFEAELDVPVFEVYRQLRVSNPSPYLYYLRLSSNGAGPVELAGSSPELLVKREGRRALVRPIAGTRPRGLNEAQDLALEAELLADPKERAEHIMLLDLGRNDLGRVASAGSVKVNQKEKVERYSQVMHLVSEVEAQLRDQLGLAELLESTFPAGTLSGAPKLRALQLIDELETTGRGLYGGAVGTLELGGDLDLAICIRTLVATAGKMWVTAGAGIVEGSSPRREFEETQAKARAILIAVERARSVQVAPSRASEGASSGGPLSKALSLETEEEAL